MDVREVPHGEVGLLLSVALLLTLDATIAPVAQQSAERDAFAVVRAIDGTRAREVWPGFDPAEWPIAVFDGTQTISCVIPTPPSEFTQMPGQPGVFTMRGRYPALLGNSTRDIAGARTATVIAPPAQPLDTILLAYVEEVFHVFWLQRHANGRPTKWCAMATRCRSVEPRTHPRRRRGARARARRGQPARGCRMGTGGAADPP